MTTIFALLVGAIGAIAIAFVVADLRFWLLKACMGLASHAARLCPEPERSRFAEEWPANVYANRDAPLTALGVALHAAARAPLRGRRLRRHSAVDENEQPEPERFEPTRPLDIGERTTWVPRPLDRASAVPLYYQLGEALKQALDSGNWNPGERFLTEREIEERFGVSRTVIRPAIDLLVADGVVARVRGEGSFVAAPKRKLSLTGLTSALCAPGDYAVTILSAAEESPGSALRQRLGIDDRDGSVVRIIALFSIDGRPVCLAESYTDAVAVPWLLRAARSLQAGAGPPGLTKIELTRASASIASASCGSWAAPRLGIAAGDPVLVAERLQYARLKRSGGEEPIESTRLIYRGDRAELTVDGG